MTPTHPSSSSTYVSKMTLSSSDVFPTKSVPESITGGGRIRRKGGREEEGGELVVEEWAIKNGGGIVAKQIKMAKGLLTESSFLPFPSLPFPSLPFPSLPFLSLPFRPSLSPTFVECVYFRYLAPVCVRCRYIW